MLCVVAVLLSVPVELAVCNWNFCVFLSLRPLKIIELVIIKFFLIFDFQRRFLLPNYIYVSQFIPSKSLNSPQNVKSFNFCKSQGSCHEHKSPGVDSDKVCESNFKKP